MQLLYVWWARLVGLFRRDRLERELHDEVTFHLDMLAAEQARGGASDVQARMHAHRAFGNVALLQEDMRDGWSLAALEHVWRDGRFAIRALRRTPGFAAVAVATLALGIGANTAILSVIDAVILRPLPYAKPDRLVMLWEDSSRLGYPRNTPAPANFLSWQSLSASFTGMAATRSALANLTADGAPEQLLGRRVTASFFTVLGVQPIIGRAFTDEEDRGNAPVTVISYGLWQRRYGGDPSIVGSSLLMNGERRTVIGIMPATFMFRSREMDFWSPMAFTPDEAATRNSHILNVVARLAPDVTLEGARADLHAINESFAALHFQGRSPLGARVRFGNAAAPWRTIIGVVRDVRERGYRSEAKPAAYVPYSQVLTSWFPENLVVRAEADPMALMPSIRRVIADADPEQPIAGVRQLQGLIDLDVVDRRDQTTLLSVFAGLALLLAALGLYGVLAHAVTQRRREIALRMALGASLTSVMRSVAVRGQRLVAVGLGAGLALALVSTRALRTLLYGVAATDPLTFVAAVGILWAVSMMASAVPALRAARLDPALVLKDE